MSNRLPADPPRIPAVILAAGVSVRMGQPKQLLRVAVSEEEVLLDRAVRLAREAGAGPVLVVLGARADEIQRTATLLDCILIFNPEWREGMASSLRAGIRALEEQQQNASAALLMVCDQPALSAEHLRRLLAAHTTTPQAAIASEYAGRCGVPAVIPRDMFARLRTLTGDQGARAILQNAPRIESIALPNGELDIDCPDDLLSWRKRTEQESPTLLISRTSNRAKDDAFGTTPSTYPA